MRTDDGPWMSTAPIDMSEAGDEWHSIQELYDHRHALYMMLVTLFPDRAWMSVNMRDGEPCEKGWCVVGLETPYGQISYHLPENEMGNLELAGVKIVDESPWDGHDLGDVLIRLAVWQDKLAEQLSGEVKHG